MIIKKYEIHFNKIIFPIKKREIFNLFYVRGEKRKLKKTFNEILVSENCI